MGAVVEAWLVSVFADGHFRRPAAGRTILVPPGCEPRRWPAARGSWLAQRPTASIAGPAATPASNSSRSGAG